jgi:Ca2+-binding RTX toxin-like protein
VHNHYVGTGNQIERFEFTDATLSLAELYARYPIQLSAGADTQTFTAAHDSRSGRHDRIHAGAGDDRVEGHSGHDTLYGEAGNDHLLGGTGQNTLHGGANDEVLEGDDDNDVLNGDAGHDTLEGGTGQDRLEGGAGHDIYRFDRGEGQDTIVDTGGDDTIEFGEHIDFDQLWFRRVGNSLEVDLIGTEDQVTLNNWYLGSSHRVEHFQAGGATLDAARVQALVNAMDDYNAPPAGEVELSADYAALLQIIGGQWENIG